MKILAVSSEFVKCIHTGEAPEDLAAWPWGVDEKSETDIGEHQAQQLGHEKQMVVMHPNEVTGTVDVQNTARKCRIGLLVWSPMLIC